MRAAVVALIFVTACSPIGGQDSTPLSPPSPPTAALAAWKDFPANSNPRPIIWFGDVYEHVDGFSTNEGKIDWLCGKFVLGVGVEFPAAGPARATARWPSGAEASFGSLGAQTAFTALLVARNSATGSSCATATPEVITAIRWGTAGFATDRGTAQMSAWLFDVGAVNGELGYPALDNSAYWGGKAAGSGGVGGRISSDGHTLTIGLVGGPDTPGPCGEDFAASAAESDTAVAVAISSRVHGGPNVACTLEGHFRTVQVSLVKPLGGRVLVDAQGKVGSVCPETRLLVGGTQKGSEWREKRESTARKSRSAAHSLTALIKRWSGRRGARPRVPITQSSSFIDSAEASNRPIEGRPATQEASSRSIAHRFDALLIERSASEPAVSSTQPRPRCVRRA